jgi:predicted transcriptional regulator
MSAVDPNARAPRRLTAADRVRRNALILAERASGESLAAIANRHGLTSRHVRSICNGTEAPQASPAVVDSEALTLSVLARYEILEGELDQLARRRNPNTQLGAVKAKLQPCTRTAPLS